MHNKDELYRFEIISALQPIWIVCLPNFLLPNRRSNHVHGLIVDFYVYDYYQLPSSRSQPQRAPSWRQLLTNLCGGMNWFTGRWSLLGCAKRRLREWSFSKTEMSSTIGYRNEVMTKLRFNRIAEHLDRKVNSAFYHKFTTMSCSKIFTNFI